MDSVTQTQIIVGAAIIRDGALLAAQRSQPEALFGRWELPGGKVDPGEEELDALVRECREELGVDIRPIERINYEVTFPPRNDGSEAVMRVWTAEILDDAEPVALEHLALRWLKSDVLADIDWLPADVPFLDAIRPHLRP
nr:(deoxy)nucleoside triphosphate pyrophosphohydrolase [Nocardiopsis mwathae]